MPLIYCSTVFILIFLTQQSKLAIGFCTNSLTTVSGTVAPKGHVCSGDLIFEDNFDTLNMRVWQHDKTLSGSFNNPFQYYTNSRSNTWVESGKLHICPTLTVGDGGDTFLTSGSIDLNSWVPNQQCTNNLNNGCRKVGTVRNIINPIQSARLSTVTSFSFKYGIVEIYAKPPTGDWLWPAFWMLSTDNSYSSWPASGEIDILEIRGNRQLVQNGVNVGIQRLTQTLHWGPNSKNNKYPLTMFNTPNTQGWGSAYHLFKMIWTPQNITFLVDGQQTGVVTPPDGGFWELGNFTHSGISNPWKGATKMAPFDQEFFLILNLACGGTSYFSDSAANSPYAKPWKNSDGTASLSNFWKAKNSWYPTWNPDTSDSHFLVDYIKVYAL